MMLAVDLPCFNTRLSLASPDFTEEIWLNSAELNKHNQNTFYKHLGGQRIYHSNKGGIKIKFIIIFVIALTVRTPSPWEEKHSDSNCEFVKARGASPRNPARVTMLSPRNVRRNENHQISHAIQ